MRAKDLRAGVVYAYRLSSYSPPVPVVVADPGALYVDQRRWTNLRPTGELAFRRAAVGERAGGRCGLPALFLPEGAEGWDLSLPVDAAEVFEQWRDVERPPGGLRAGVVSPRTIVEPWVDHAAREQARRAAEASRTAVRDELEGRRREREVETIDALERAGVRLHASWARSETSSDVARLVRGGATDYVLSQASVDQLLHALGTLKAQLAEHEGAEAGWRLRVGELLLMPEPPPGTRLSYLGHAGAPLGVWERRAGGWHLEGDEGGGPLPWSSVRQYQLSVARWGLPRGEEVADGG